MSREIKSPEPVLMSATSADGKHTIEFNEGSHRYKMNGKPAVGVTTFCKSGYVTSFGLVHYEKENALASLFRDLTIPGEGGAYPREGFWPINDQQRKDLFKTAHNAYKAPLQEAADIGTICHGYAELHSLGKFEEAEKLLDQVRKAEAWPLINACVSKYKEWDAKNRGKLVHAECLVGSPRYLFCGKFDRLDMVDKKLILRDYKTSKDIYLDQYIQMAAYSIALKEWLGLEVGGLEVLRFGKDDGTFDHLLIDDPKEIKMFQDQAIRCRYTHEFRKLENDARFDWKKKQEKKHEQQ